MNGMNLLPEKYKNKIELTAFVKKTASVTAVIFMLPLIVMVCLNALTAAEQLKLAGLRAETGDAKFDFSDRVYRELLETREKTERAELALGAESVSDLSAMIQKIYDAAPDGVSVAEASYNSDFGRFGSSGYSTRADAISDYIKRLGEHFYGASLTRLNAEAGGRSAFTVEMFSGGEDSR